MNIIESPVQWHPSLFTVARPHRFLGVLHMGARATLVRLSSGKLFVHSPVELSDKLRSRVDELGEVSVLVAPNRFHHLWVEDWQQAYPDARTFAAPGLTEKKPGVRFDGTLGSEPDPEWAEDLGQVLIEGAPQLGEVVFYHLESQTLISCDLLINIHNSQSRLTRFYLRMMGIQNRPGFSKALKAAYEDKPKARASIDRILEWPFERAIVSHGQVIEEGGHDILRDAYRWLG